jgi:hypothetical protein
MPPASKRPSPPARMVALLAAEKRRLLAEKGHVTHSDFRVAWDHCWEIMVLEKSWAHQTPIRRGSRAAMLATRSEARAAFLEESTAFAFASSRISSAAEGMCLHLDPQQTPEALLAAIAYVEIAERQELAAA